MHSIPPERLFAQATWEFDPRAMRTCKEQRVVGDGLVPSRRNAFDNAPRPRANDRSQGEARAIIPHLIRLFSAEEGTTWLARVEPSARPLLTDEDVE